MKKTNIEYGYVVFIIFIEALIIGITLKSWVWGIFLFIAGSLISLRIAWIRSLKKK